MGAAVIAGEGHDDKVFEVRDAGLAHPDLTLETAGEADGGEADTLLLENIFFVEGPGEVNFVGSIAAHLLLGVLEGEPHGQDFLLRPEELSDLEPRVALGEVRVLDVTISARVPQQQLKLGVLLQGLDLADECLDLVVALGVLDLAHWLLEFQVVDYRAKDALYGRDLAPVVGRNLQLDLGDAQGGVGALYQLAI